MQSTPLVMGSKLKWLLLVTQACWLFRNGFVWVFLVFWKTSELCWWPCQPADKLKAITTTSAVSISLRSQQSFSKSNSDIPTRKNPKKSRQVIVINCYSIIINFYLVIICLFSWGLVQSTTFQLKHKSLLIFKLNNYDFLMNCIHLYVYSLIKSTTLHTWELKTSLES